MRDHIETVIAGETVVLSGKRGLFWPRFSRLLIADLHLGKGDIMRRAGIPIPVGGTQSDLSRLSELVAQFSPESIWVLGDMVHGRMNPSEWLSQWNRWQISNNNVEVCVLRGNHDYMIMPETLGVRVLPPDLVEEPFAFRHKPGKVANKHVICGHIHPVAKVPGLRRRWPSFVLDSYLTILPAFSQFTGGSVVGPSLEERIIVCVEGMAVEVPYNRQKQYPLSGRDEA